MPKLRDVLAHELGSDSAPWSLSPSLLDDSVVAVYLNTGAPCDSHAGAFEAWPGQEADVGRWLRLAGGPAVGIRSRDDEAQGLAVWGQGGE